MNPEAIEELLSKIPFTPFRLTLSTGETVDVIDPNSVFIMNSALYAFGVKRKGAHVAEWFRIITLFHIVKVEQIETSAAA